MKEEFLTSPSLVEIDARNPRRCPRHSPSLTPPYFVEGGECVGLCSRIQDGS